MPNSCILLVIPWNPHVNHVFVVKVPRCGFHTINYSNHKWQNYKIIAVNDQSIQV